jgi:putative DNA methylase
MSYKKKLIEVALPLEAINKESAREKSIRHGHPSTLHLWWSRKPLATCRAVLFASLVDDPSARPEEFPTEEAQEKERKRLFHIIEKLVIWENSNNEEVLEEVRREIMKSTGGNPPHVLDPFCGGGSIPFEAQRLGLQAHGSDLNPVAVMITKALIEIPPKFTGKPPVNPEAIEKMFNKTECIGATGLAEDVKYYGQWMKQEVEKKIGHLYPKGPNGETVIAWLWARTVKCPNPACGAEMPLTNKFELSKKKGNIVWIKPVIDRENKKVSFEVKTGEGKAHDGTVNRHGGKCIVCDMPVPFEYIRGEGKEGRLSQQMMAIVMEGNNKRTYISPIDEHVKAAFKSKPEWKPDTELPEKALGFRVQRYGITKHGDLFTNRQLLVLTTFCDLLKEVREIICKDALKAGMNDDKIGINDCGKGAKAYSEAVVTYLALAISRITQYWSNISSWHTSGEKMQPVFARQAIPMMWDFAETNPLSNSSGNWIGGINWIAKVIEAINSNIEGKVVQSDVVTLNNKIPFVISTDPPYYDNIGYADLSDFFYVWLRKNLSSIYPDIFRTMLVPKQEELIATPYRFDGNKKKAEEFFLTGLGKAFSNIKNIVHPDYPLTVYYAFKQSEEDTEGVSSTGWETMLEGLIKAGFQINGTWPMRTEMTARALSRAGTNALASSIVLVCRPREETSSSATRRDFINTLRKELPLALKNLQQGNIAPVDLAQTTIGPGMAIFTRFSKVLEADGNPMSVKAALQIINQELDLYLVEQEGEMDQGTRFCVSWYEQYGFNEGAFGEADVLSRAKNTSVEGLTEAGVIQAIKGKVRLLKLDELDEDWNPQVQKHKTIWLNTHQLVRALNKDGEVGAAKLLYKIPLDARESAKALSYRLYTIAERKGRTDEGVSYNNLVVSWPYVQRHLEDIGKSRDKQLSMF